MLEQLLGTALLCCIITTFFYCLFYKIACRFKIMTPKQIARI